MTTRSAACSLVSEEQLAIPWDWKPRSQAPPRPHCTLPHQAPAAGSALRHPREQDLAQSLCPPPQHTCPLLTRLTSHLAAARPAARAPPLEPRLSGRFVLPVPSALLFLASPLRVLGAFPGLKGPQPHLILTSPIGWPGSSSNISAGDA